LGANIPGNGTYGEFTFEYVGSTAVKTVQDKNFKVVTTNKQLKVEYTKGETAKVSIYNLSGNLIYSKQLLNGTMVTELPVAGVYLVKLSTQGNSLVKRVVVN